MQLKKITKIENKSKKYDIQTSTQNFFVNGILVHNSLLISDYANDQFSMRTRGTLSYRQLENATDFEYAMQKYPAVAEFVKSNSNLSVLFEIVSPNCRIVLSYGKEPDIYLVGAVNKDNYSLLTQRRLDEIAAEIKVKRPTRYTADNFNELFSEITSANDIEGCCVYSSGDQSIHKLKSEHYLTLHRMKSEMGNINRVIDRFFLLGCPGYETFYQDLVKNFDFEIAESNKENVRLVCDAGEKLAERLGWIKSFLADLQTRSSERKFQALEIIRWFTSGLGKKYTSIGFSYLDNKAPQEKILRELLESFIDANKFEVKSFFSSAAEAE